MFIDANGNQFESFEAACYYYGADTPDQAAAEEAMWDAIETEEWLDHCAAFDLFVDNAFWAEFDASPAIPF